MKQYFKEFVHNAIVHPLMMFIPRDWAHHMHDVNAQWAFGSNRFDEIGIEEGMKSLGGNNDNTPSTAHSITATELERLRKDAERYRWLRMQGAQSDKVDKVHCFGPKLDEAIDAAIAAEGDNK